MSEEQRVKRAKGLFSEYLSAADLKEAVACAQEITTPGELSVYVILQKALSGTAYGACAQNIVA